MSQPVPQGDVAPELPDPTLDDAEAHPLEEGLSTPYAPPSALGSFAVPPGHVLVPEATWHALMARLVDGGPVPGADRGYQRKERKASEPILLEPLARFTIGDLNVIVTPDMPPIEWVPNDHLKIDGKKHDSSRSFQLAFDLQNPYSEKYRPHVPPNFRVLNPDVAQRYLVPKGRPPIPGAFADPDQSAEVVAAPTPPASYESKYIHDFRMPAVATAPPQEVAARSPVVAAPPVGSAERRALIRERQEAMIAASERTQSGASGPKGFRENATRGQTMLDRPEKVGDFPVRRPTSPAGPPAGARYPMR